MSRINWAADRARTLGRTGHDGAPPKGQPFDLLKRLPSKRLRGMTRDAATDTRWRAAAMAELKRRGHA